MAAVSMMVSTIVPVSQSTSGSKKLSKIHGTKLHEEGNTGKACNFSSGCDIGIVSECPYIADCVGGCYCIHGLCYWISGFGTWNNGKSGAELNLTSSTTTGLQIHTVDHIRTANPCDWLPSRRAALLLVGCPHSLVYLHLPVVEGLISCISATPHLGTSFPLFPALTSAS